MKTKILDNHQLQEARFILLQGGLVVFPTETVYGLGANGLDEQAVAKIFSAKGRPSDNPLILHIHDKRQLDDIVLSVPEGADELMAAFWPGPLTLVFEKQPHIPLNVTAGLSTVAVRMPRHEIALALLQSVNVPLAAPSANQSGRPSATTLEHVYHDLDGKVDAIIEGGSSVIGIESTVLDLTTTPPTLLRPGYITKNEIEAVLGKPIQSSTHSDAPKSPGMKYQHYQPRVPVYWRTGNRERIHDELAQMTGVVSIIESPTEQNFYALLRAHDKPDVTAIVVITPPADSLSEGLRDRLDKASSKK